MVWTMGVGIDTPLVIIAGKEYGLNLNGTETITI